MGSFPRGTLFHGTTLDNLSSIKQSGLSKGTSVDLRPAVASEFAIERSHQKRSLPIVVIVHPSVKKKPYGSHYVLEENVPLEQLIIYPPDRDPRFHSSWGSEPISEWVKKKS
jgi:hypothetical protein